MRVFLNVKLIIISLLKFTADKGKSTVKTLWDGFSFSFNCLFAYNELWLIIVVFFSVLKCCSSSFSFLLFLFWCCCLSMLLVLLSFSWIHVFFFCMLAFPLVHYLYNLFGLCISGQRACLVSASFMQSPLQRRDCFYAFFFLRL
jgi:hypothetical protein